MNPFSQMQRCCPMGKHAVLSASGSHKWYHCTPSARLEQEFENRESTAAAEGTAAHELAEHKLRKALKMRSKKPISPFDSDEMDEHTEAYMNFVLEQLELAKQTCPDPVVLIEQRLDFSNYVPDGCGTVDILLIADKNLHIIDLKYGSGIVVSAELNSQMMLYALAALDLYDNLYDLEEVSMTIFQPRRENVSTWTISADALKDWCLNELMPRAELAFKGEGEFCPGDWCTFCRAAVKCRARAEEKLRLAQSEFLLPPLLADDEIEVILGKLNDISKWANDLMAYALDAAINHGKQWVGYKVVEGRSNRRFKDENAVAESAKNHGYNDIFKQNLITLTEFEKLMGKVKFNEILGDLVEKPPGKPTLVPFTDKRTEMNVSNARNDFKEMMEDE